MPGCRGEGGGRFRFGVLEAARDGGGRPLRSRRGKEGDKMQREMEFVFLFGGLVLVVSPLTGMEYKMFRRHVPVTRSSVNLSAALVFLTTQPDKNILNV